VLTDRTPVSNGLTGGIVSFRTWRFADLATRLEFLLAGFGWCNMPLHLVRDHIDSGALKALDITEPTLTGLDIHVIHERGRGPGKAGRGLIEDLRQREMSCTEGGLTSDQPAASIKIGHALRDLGNGRGNGAAIHQSS